MSANLWKVRLGCCHLELITEIVNFLSLLFLYLVVERRWSPATASYAVSNSTGLQQKANGCCPGHDSDSSAGSFDGGVVTGPDTGGGDSFPCVQTWRAGTHCSTITTQWLGKCILSSCFVLTIISIRNSPCKYLDQDHVFWSCCCCRWVSSSSWPWPSACLVGVNEKYKKSNAILLYNRQTQQNFITHCTLRCVLLSCWDHRM